MIKIHRKALFVFLVYIVFSVLVVFVVNPLAYIVGLIWLEVFNPRKVVFEGAPGRVWENGFELAVGIPCNRIYERNVYVLFDGSPFGREAEERPVGSFYFKVEEGGEYYEVERETQYLRYLHLDRPKLFILVPLRFPEYPVLGGFNCSGQQVYLRFDNLNFDPQPYEIIIKVERIGIDG